MLNHLFRPIVFAILLIVSASTHSNARQIHVVTSFSILANMVARIGGDRVIVMPLVGPNADAHVYEPRPQDAEALDAADLIIVNGLGFDTWMDRLVEASATHAPVKIATTGISALNTELTGHQVADPHAWQNLANGKIYVKNIANALCAVDPDDCVDFKNNLQDYASEIEKLDSDIRRRILQIPEDRRIVITTHDAFAYFGAAYGIQFHAAEGISTESDPSAADLAKLVRQIRQNNTSVLFLENMSDPRLIEQISNETGVKLGGTLYADALTTTSEGGASYLAMFKHNADLLISAMAQQ